MFADKVLAARKLEREHARAYAHSAYAFTHVRSACARTVHMHACTGACTAAEAMEALEKALATRLLRFGPDHPDVSLYMCAHIRVHNHEQTRSTDIHVHAHV